MASEAFEERYEILRELGRGAMGRVVLARDRRAQREVAIKLLAAQELGERAGARLQREGELLASLRHPGVVRVHSVGLWRGQPYLVMDHVEGARELGQLERAQRLPLLLEAARALAHVHARGLVHRDLKPANLLVDAQGRVRVCDFGLAWSAESRRLTRTGHLAGTPLYMAPEQFRGAREGQAFEPPTDVWALGVILYEALTGRAPFEEPTLVAQMAEVLACEPTPPRSLEPSVSPALEAVCAKALQKRPQDRYSDAGEFAEALEAALATRGPRRGLAALPAPLALVALTLMALALMALALLAPAARLDGSPSPPPGERSTSPAAGPAPGSDTGPAAGPAPGSAAGPAPGSAAGPAPGSAAGPAPGSAAGPAPGSAAGSAAGASPAAGAGGDFAARLREVPAAQRRAFAWSWLRARPAGPAAEAARAFLRAGGADAPLWVLRTQDERRAPLGVAFRGPRSLVTYSERAAWSWSLGEAASPRLKVAHGRIGGVSPLPDGRVVLLRSTGEVKRVSCYELREGAWSRAWIKGSPRAFTQLCAAAQGELLAYAFLDVPRRRLVWLLDAQGERLARLSGLSPGPVRGLALAPAGGRAFLLEGAQLSEWDLSARGRVEELEGPQRSVEVDPQTHSLLVVPTGALLALDHARGAELYDAQTLEPAGRLGRPSSAARALTGLARTLACDAGGGVLARLAGRDLELWSLPDARPLRPAIRLPALPQDLSVSADGALVAVGLADGSCQVWPVRPPE